MTNQADQTIPGGLAARRIYFGHQSVGSDILAGLGEILKATPATHLRIVDSADPRELDQPGLVHSKIGSNGDPESKLQAFANYLAAGMGQRADLALMKFCYVDIESHTDVDALFSRYTSFFADLQARYPNVRFAHCTVPLTARPGGLKSFIKQRLGKPLWGDDQNRRRHAFNQRLRQTFAQPHQLFDLARLESTLPDGSPHLHLHAGAQQPSLVHDLTHDGGHLNATGKRIVATEFLRFLTRACA